MYNVKVLEKFDMCNDQMFKAVFRSIEARSIVISFLSKVTGIKESILKNATFNGGEIVKSNINEKKKESDIIITITDDRKLIIEMNRSLSSNMFEKNSQYAFSIINELTSSSKRYQQVILINIDNFNKFKTKEAILTFKIRDEYGHIENMLYTSIHLILDNIVNLEYNKINKEIYDFCCLLKTTTLEEIKELVKRREDYMAAFRKVEDLSTNPEFIGYYDVEEAHKQDIEDAKEYGIEQGIEKGIQQGIEKEKIEIAKSLLTTEMKIEEISKHTGLSLEELEEIKNEK